jgi:hypothetical protein
VEGVPAVVRNNAVAAGAAAWLDELPALLAHLEREWSIVRVSTGLLCTKLDLQPAGREMLAVADRVAE